MKSVAITGASGFIGRCLTALLLERGYHVVALSRRPAAASLPDAVERRHFDPTAGKAQPEAFRNVDAVVHLAGESVAGRWTPAKKAAIEASRVDGTRWLVASLENASPPQALISASASGYYGSRGDESLFENSHPGADFLAGVCANWEREAFAARRLGIRVACLRTGIALGRGGALEQMLKPFRLGLGGPFGAGRQFVPWIDVNDLAALYVFALENGSLEGPINAVTPDYATSARFAQALGSALRRPALLPAPAFALKALLGEFATTLLGSQLIIPATARAAGFKWRYDQLENALAGIVAGTPRSSSLVRRFSSEQWLDVPLEQVFGFFSNPRNLEALTPPALRFEISAAPDALAAGAQISYRLRLRNLRFGWKTLIAQWDPPHAFVDVQMRGPYAFWQHSHRFSTQNNGTLINDDVLYALPFAPLGGIVAPLVDSDVRAIFAYRRAEIARRFRDPMPERRYSTS